MKFQKTTIMIPGGPNGGREQTVYAAKGIGVGQLSPKRWGIFCTGAQMEIYYGLQRRTKAEALEAAREILSLDVDWTKDKNCKEFEEQFKAAIGKIRELAALSR